MENGRSEDDEVPRRMWEAVEAKVGKIEIGKVKERREERKRGKKVKRKRKNQKKKR